MTDQANGGGPGSSDSRRAALIEAAQARWVDALTDLGGRNTLLYYKDRRAGTLDLGLADPAALDQFRRTGSIRLTRLFRDVDVRADAIRRVQAIYRKARELLEERGIRAGYLATGMARWDELFLEPAAPVLLRGLTITATRARHDDFDLALDDESEVNPVLLHKLASVFGAATEKLADERGDQLFRLLQEAADAAEVPGFEIICRDVIGTFTYAKLPMVRDMQAAGELLADSDVVAAIAGDPEAQELLCTDDGTEPVLDSPAEDYSVLDADSSQRSAIAAVLSGRSVVIHGPPGTGKSQKIANLMAALVARGRKVLFVAEKRAAIDAVLSRLKGADLGEMVLDIHEGTRDRLRIARDLAATSDLAQQAHSPDDGSLRRRPGTAGRQAVRRGDLRRGEPDRAGRRDPVDHAGTSDRGRRRRPATAADQLFRQVGEGDEESADDDDESLVLFGAGFESVLDALRPLLPTWPLAWHYRSRDERLVAFSNTHIYGGALTTFPGVFRDDCLRHVVVAQSPERGQEVSVTAEVDKVVELILEHARTRPHESLGVIALGMRHAERIETALRAVLAEHPELRLPGRFRRHAPRRR